jgi:hypothetical protein
MSERSNKLFAQSPNHLITVHCNGSVKWGTAFDSGLSGFLPLNPTFSVRGCLTKIQAFMGTLSNIRFHATWLSFSHDNAFIIQCRHDAQRAAGCITLSARLDRLSGGAGLRRPNSLNCGIKPQTNRCSMLCDFLLAATLYWSKRAHEVDFWAWKLLVNDESSFPIPGRVR